MAELSDALEGNVGRAEGR